jgi:hypothetical protein
MAGKINTKVAMKSSPKPTHLTGLICHSCNNSIMSNEISTWKHIWFPDGSARRSVFRKYHKKCGPTVSVDAGKNR